jgi:hypothetical protein
MTISKSSKKVRIKKVGGIAAILFTCGSFGSVALADCREIVALDAEALAIQLRCSGYRDGLDAEWKGDPIWQYKGKKGDGCEVHYRLAKKLDEEPQLKTTVKGKPKNTNRGVASALRAYKDEAAIESLQQFMDTIMYNAKLNPDPDVDAAAAAQAFVDDASLILTWVYGLPSCPE